MAIKSMARLGAIQVTKNLEGISFPTSRQGLIDFAREKGAPKEMYGLLERMPDKQYESMEDVRKEAEKAD